MPAEHITKKAHRGEKLVAAIRRRRETLRRIINHKDRVRGLPPLLPGEADRMIAAFVAQRGVTPCPPASGESAMDLLLRAIGDKQ